MPEFQAWQHSDIDSKERVLWIRGPLGIGKTYMAGCFVDLLGKHRSTHIVLYFFCQTGRAGEKARLAKARDILGTLAFQYYNQSDYSVRSNLEGLKFKESTIADTPMRLLCEVLLES